MTLKEVELRLWDLTKLAIQETAPDTLKGIHALINDVQTTNYPKYPSAKTLVKRALRKQLKALK
jgi:hypothetical protein